MRPLALAGAAAGLGAGAVVAGRALRDQVPIETGRFPGGIEYARFGDGPRTLLWLDGGPGSSVPHGLLALATARRLAPLLDAGYSVWQLTRGRDLPLGHTIGDMADDYARLVETEFGGWVDGVLGLSYGGMIAQYLAARHGDRVGRVVVALCAATITDWGRDVDRRWAEARAAGRTSEAGTVMAEYFWPRPDQLWLRRLVGPALGLALRHEPTSANDLLVEAAAEAEFDARVELPAVRVPVLLFSGEKDLFFSPQMVEDTVALIPGCTQVQYAGMGHMRAASSSRLVRDAAAFLSPPLER